MNKSNSLLRAERVLITETDFRTEKVGLTKVNVMIDGERKVPYKTSLNHGKIKITEDPDGENSKRKNVAMKMI